ncbi:Apolipoprotein N-acyltransferase [Desulfamplus magnetovallimortis]|uniref:Apolipoprotein N-acyltransferase n=1 Tax=Desulfamplus magnetovallimortis TaxID=1246637 RepID=A0A1W1HJ83_9BACT|nr:apolipoprotein N-acyltransferase [Desulfamplus magnetovallimortis]SLM32561.1 Apolipoprotein N-acyltransferase [Desulfamplus magnetovallimortis]
MKILKPYYKNPSSDKGGNFTSVDTSVTSSWGTILSRYFPAVISGTLLTLAFPEANFSWLAWVAFIPLIVSLRKMGGKHAFYAGFIMGFVHFISLLYWIVPTISTYGELPFFLSLPILILLTLYLALYPAIFSFGVSCFKNHLMPLAASSIWVSLEFLRSWLFTGFPWGLTGSSQYMNLELIQIADITSVYGVSFVILMTNGVLAMTIESFFAKDSVLVMTLKSIFAKDSVLVKAVENNFVKDCVPEITPESISSRVWKRSWMPHFLWYILLVAVLIVVFTYGKMRISQVQEIADHGEHVTISLIQGNIEQLFKWDNAYKNKTIEKYCDLSMKAATMNGAGKKPDLIVWPETALPFYYIWNREFSEKVDECIQRADTTFLVGSPAFEALAEDGYELFNRSYMVNPGGFVTGHYDKIHLVPFGEYVPFGKYLSFLGKIIAQAGNFSPGKPPARPLAFNGSSAGVLICFEIIFPSLSRNMVKNGAKVLVNTTNDAWFGYTSAPKQHFSMAVFRAIENRRAVARAANTGISGFIQPTGAVVDASGLYVDAVLTRSVPSMTLQTIYCRWGNFFVILCLVATGAISVINVKKQKPDRPSTGAKDDQKKN